MGIYLQIFFTFVQREREAYETQKDLFSKYTSQGKGKSYETQNYLLLFRRTKIERNTIKSICFMTYNLRHIRVWIYTHANRKEKRTKCKYLRMHLKATYLLKMELQDERTENKIENNKIIKQTNKHKSHWTTVLRNIFDKLEMKCGMILTNQVLI